VLCRCVRGSGSSRWLCALFRSVFNRLMREEKLQSRRTVVAALAPLLATASNQRTVLGAVVLHLLRNR
jgi:hypothetical protein